VGIVYSNNTLIKICNVWEDHAKKIVRLMLLPVPVTTFKTQGKFVYVAKLDSEN